ncbi:hypothetical protein E6W39_29010 [Kitasatospora acidiphila]|uniref:Uncharacterized protein n=1 Tax=Kitasatospora acidiphila TaxID=2567942 RepID=A0A540W926_9ACTN|nr:hypothetical protein [Kitasatospora acidiphila]TQF05529.1 hypothetical protein E6W39_29010 [Kitasatospora acidiphila]
MGIIEICLGTGAFVVYGMLRFTEKVFDQIPVLSRKAIIGIRSLRDVKAEWRKGLARDSDGGDAGR